MALESVKLDDLNWRDMVTSIQSRVTPNSAGHWTHHAPVDPGITLLELFAHLLEQRLYWLDQTPDILVSSFITLLGEEPSPAHTASTIVQLTPTDKSKVLQGPGNETLALPARTALRLPNTFPPITFTTQDAIALLPIARIELWAEGRNRTSDLERGWIRLIPANGKFGEIKIILWLNQKFPASRFDGIFTLLIDLDAPPGIPSHWSNDAVLDIRPPANLQWQYSSTGPSHRKSFEPDQIEDGTGGLRRSGIIRFTLPEDWSPAGDPDDQGNTPYEVRVSTEKATFTSPPLLMRLLPNVVIARHESEVEVSPDDLLHQTRDWLPLPGLTLELPHDQYLAIKDSVYLRIMERDGQWHTWNNTNNFSFHGPEDRVFTQERNLRVLKFGDGLTGRIPVLYKGSNTVAQPRVRICYLAGAGNEGNVGSNRSWDVDLNAETSDCTANYSLKAVNLVPAEGGAEPESIKSAQERVAAALRTRHRAVTKPDYEHLATTTPGVSIERAYAALGYHPAHPCNIVPGAITVFIVPYAPRDEVYPDWVDSVHVAAPLPDPGALAAVRDWLAERRLIASEVHVRAPVYRPVSIAVDLVADSVDLATFRVRIQDSLSKYLDPLVGGDEEHGWPFGQTLQPSALVRRVQATLGEAADVQRLAIGIDDQAPTTDCADVPIRDHELIYFKSLSVNVQCQVTQSGGLR